MVDRADQSVLEARWSAAVATGDFGAARAIVPELRDAFGDVRSFALELDAARWLAGRADARLPAPASVVALAGSGSTDALARASGFCVRAAVLGFDAHLAGEHEAVLRALAAREDAGIETGVRAEVARTWASLLAGDRAGAANAAVEASRRARAGSVGAAVVEVQIAQALVALGDSDVGGATMAARRAVRMARSEGTPQDEFLANVVLARVRRASGAPHLATRILVALRDLASAPFREWIEYELALAGGETGRAGGGDEAPAGVAHAIDALTHVLSSGDREIIDAAAAALFERTRGFADIELEVRDLLVVLGAASVDRASPPVAAWVTGGADAVPRGLHAFGTQPDDDGGPVVAWVVVPPDGRAFRILAAGRYLAMSEGGGVTPVLLEPGRRPQERTDAAIALLALRGSAMDEERFFHDLYGFPFKPSLHTSVMSTLVHRIRNTLGDAATLHREGGTLRLEPHLPLVAWDPRCQRPLEDRILSVLTRGGPSTAKRAADRLGVPLRTVQAALGQLVEDGACKRDRQGRAVEYSVEDTTFSEPTVTRARAWREATRVTAE